MLTLQLLWISGLMSWAMVIGFYSRAALGQGALAISAGLVVWGALVAAAWLRLVRRRARGVAGRADVALLVAAMLAGLAIPFVHSGRDYGIRALGAFSLLPLAAPAFCAAAAFLARAARPSLRDGPGTHPHGLPPVRDVLLALAPLLVIPAMAAGLRLAALPEALQGRVSLLGVTGVLFAEIGVHAPGAAVLLGLGLDRLDGSREAWLSRVLGAAAVLALLLAALFTPYGSPALDFGRRIDGELVTTRLPLDPVRHLTPAALLALGLLLRRDLGLLASGFRGTPPALLAALVLGVGAGTALLTAPVGTWVAPALTAVGCAALLFRRPTEHPRAEIAPSTPCPSSTSPGSPPPSTSVCSPSPP